MSLKIIFCGCPPPTQLPPLSFNEAPDRKTCQKRVHFLAPLMSGDMSTATPSGSMVHCSARFWPIGPELLVLAL